MNLCRLFLYLFLTCFLSIECGKKNSSKEDKKIKLPQKEKITETYDPKRGIGEFDSTNLILKAIDLKLVNKGKEISNTKCFTCHYIDDKKFVGPGWKGITERRTPYWIMNFITNPNEMIDKDPELLAQLEICMIRMPNQNISKDDAFSILEFMRKNDEKK